MTIEVSTPHLRLIALSVEQLKLSLIDLTSLGNELGIPVSGNIIDKSVVGAINLKSAKMMTSESTLHAWFTYWLIVVKDVPYGAGLIGFKGIPSAEGEVEIGYGIDSAYRNKGYMTEAVQVLRDWAFSHEECRTVVAVTDDNPRSERVLQKCGFQKFSQQGDETTWKINRDDC